MTTFQSLFLAILLLLSTVTMVQGRLTGLVDRFHPPNTTFCERIGPDELPSECLCRDAALFGFDVTCVKVFNNTFFNDTIGLKLVVDPCNPQGSKLSLDITEANHAIDYPISGIRAGEQQLYPIPGLAIMVPTIGSLGVDAVVSISGNPDQLTLMVGLNACTMLHHHAVCASSVPGLNRILPWWVLSGTYAFGDMCNGTSVIATSTTTKASAVDLTTSALINNVLKKEE